MTSKCIAIDYAACNFGERASLCLTCTRHWKYKPAPSATCLESSSSSLFLLKDRTNRCWTFNWLHCPNIIMHSATLWFLYYWFSGSAQARETRNNQFKIPKLFILIFENKTIRSPSFQSVFHKHLHWPFVCEVKLVHGCSFRVEEVTR